MVNPCLYLSPRIIVLYIMNVIFFLTDFFINLINFGKCGILLAVTNINENIVLLSSFLSVNKLFVS